MRFFGPMIQVGNSLTKITVEMTQLDFSVKAIWQSKAPTKHAFLLETMDDILKRRNSKLNSRCLSAALWGGRVCSA